MFGCNLQQQNKQKQVKALASNSEELELYVTKRTGLSGSFRFAKQILWKPERASFRLRSKQALTGLSYSLLQDLNSFIIYQQMIIQIISLFPEMFPPVLETSMLWKAKDKGIVDYQYINLRDFGLGARKTVDDTPYGGGDGMLLKPEPVVAAIEYAKGIDPDALVILPTPRGKLYKQSDAKEMALHAKGLIFVCPRYEGYDERITSWVDWQYCIGNYILTGGELPAMAIIDSVVRLLPGVLGGETSADIESFSAGSNIEYPQYTRPQNFRGIEVPSVLLNGNHKEIDTWRSKPDQN